MWVERRAIASASRRRYRPLGRMSSNGGRLVNHGTRRRQGPDDRSNAEEAGDAAFVGGPVALAWSRFSDEVRARVSARYLEAIESWRDGRCYKIPGEFVIAAAVAAKGS